MPGTSPFVAQPADWNQVRPCLRISVLSSAPAISEDLGICSKHSEQLSGSSLIAAA